MTSLAKSRTFVTLLTAIGLTIGKTGKYEKSQSLENQVLIMEFWVQKYSQKKETYDIVTFGNSRSYTNINYQIIESYLPRDCNIFNFGFGGRSFASRQILQNGMRLLKKNGKRIFIFFLSNQMQHTSGLPYQAEVSDFKRSKTLFTYSLFMPTWTTGKPSGDSVKIRIHDKQSWLEVQSPKVSASRNIEDVRVFFRFSGLKMALDFCKKNNIRVVALHAPTGSALYDLEELSFKKYGIEKMLAQNGVLYLRVPKEHLRFESYDSVHLTVASGERFSHWLGRELAKLEWLK